MTDQTIDLLDATLDDLEDMPSNAPFPPGAHSASMVLSTPKVVPGKPTKSMVIAKFTYKATLEAADPAAPLPNPGDECTIFMSMKTKEGQPNSFGQGTLKMILGALAEGGVRGDTNRETIAMTSKGVDVVIVTGINTYNGNDSMTLVKIAME